MVEHAKSLTGLSHPASEADGPSDVTGIDHQRSPDLGDTGGQHFGREGRTRADEDHPGPAAQLEQPGQGFVGEGGAGDEDELAVGQQVLGRGVREIVSRGRSLQDDEVTAFRVFLDVTEMTDGGDPEIRAGFCVTFEGGSLILARGEVGTDPFFPGQEEVDGGHPESGQFQVPGPHDRRGVLEVAADHAAFGETGPGPQRHRNTPG